MSYSESAKKRMNRAMQLSLAIGILMLFLKMYAYFLTRSTAILSDAAESIVHVFAVGFAVYSMWLSHKPADKDHQYGHDRITFFSAGFEGGMILIAGLFIIYHSIGKILFGFELENLDQGMIFITIATALNGALGLFLVKQGRRYHSGVLKADGQHILADCITSLGVLVALVLTHTTGWIYFDPLIAIGIGVNILWTGVRLVFGAIHGLMDRADPEMHHKVCSILKREAAACEIDYHQLRHRDAGNRLFIEVHLLFPDHLPISEAHERATLIEKRVEAFFDKPVELVSHLEPLEAHDEVHQELLGRSG